MNLNLENLWLPFTNNRSFKEDPLIVTRAEGNYLWSGDTKIFDGCSGLFTSPAGHRRPEIEQAIHEQLTKLDYVAPFERAHEKSAEVSTKLAGMLPSQLDRVFFTNSGSESVDTAMKMALAYHYVRGDKKRQMFVSRERAYHGVNLGGTALSGLPKNREAFRGGLPTTLHLRHTWDPKAVFHRGQRDGGEDLAYDLQRFVDLHGADAIAACFVEPVAGSTGVLVPPKGYLQTLREICTKNGILLVFDEVITGFGRIGAPFACQEFDVMPDMICLAKALANGVQPIGAVVAHRHVYDALMEGAEDGMIEFFHGYTWSGHPVATAAASATLDIYENDQLFQRGQELEKPFLDELYGLEGIRGIKDIRGYGMFGAVELEPEGTPGRRGTRLQRELFLAGLHLKATGDNLLLAPPMTSDIDDLKLMGDILRSVLK